MIELLIKHSIAFLYLLAGSISDIKRREVADWANYGLICIAIASNLIFSLALNDWNYTLNSLIGFAAFLILALIMFYAGQWGGGDSKMLMGMGALYGLSWRWQDSSFLAYFLVNTLIAGAVYGIVWSIVVAIRNSRKFTEEYKKIISKKEMKLPRIALLVFLAISVMPLIFANNAAFKLMFFSIAVISISTFYLWILIKAVENSCMYKYVSPDKLTEGDWIAKDVKYQGKYITGPKDLGISKKQIAKLKSLYSKGKVKKILIKEGIPFVPSFFIGWLMALAFGNIFSFFI